MRITAMHLLVALVAGCVLTSSASEGVHQTRKTLQKSASATSSATSVSTGDGFAFSDASAASLGGTAIANAFASSDVQTQTTSIFTNITTKVVGAVDPDNCTDILLTADTEISAQGQAVASVYVEAFGMVEVDGDGSACASAEAAGDAVADAFARAVAAAIVEITSDDNRFDVSSEAVADVTAAATATAWADAFADTCTTGGFGEAAQTSFAEAIVTPLVEVYAFALGGVECQEEVAAFSDAQVDGTSSTGEDVMADTTTTTTATGDTMATAGGGADATTDVADTADETAAITGNDG